MKFLPLLGNFLLPKRSFSFLGASFFPWADSTPQGKAPPCAPFLSRGPRSEYRRAVFFSVGEISPFLPLSFSPLAGGLETIFLFERRRFFPLNFPGMPLLFGFLRDYGPPPHSFAAGGPFLFWRAHVSLRERFCSVRRFFPPSSFFRGVKLSVPFGQTDDVSPSFFLFRGRLFDLKGLFKRRSFPPSHGCAWGFLDALFDFFRYN